MSEQEATHLMLRCSIQTQTKEEDKAMEEGAMQAKAGTIKGNPGNKTSTTNKTPQTHKAERQEEGGITMRTEPSTQVRRVQILWQVWPL